MPDRTLCALVYDPLPFLSAAAAVLLRSPRAVTRENSRPRAPVFSRDFPPVHDCSQFQTKIGETGPFSANWRVYAWLREGPAVVKL